MQIDEKEFDPHHLIMQSIRMMQDRAKRKEVDLITALSVGETSFWADPQRLKQILPNVLSNAG